MKQKKYKFSINCCLFCKFSDRKTHAEPCRSCKKENKTPTNYVPKDSSCQLLCAEATLRKENI